jgi:hypothetical protein
MKSARLFSRIPFVLFPFFDIEKMFSMANWRAPGMEMDVMACLRIAGIVRHGS